MHVEISNLDDIEMKTGKKKLNLSLQCCFKTRDMQILFDIETQLLQVIAK